MSTRAEDANLEIVLADESASYWLKSALREALKRDPVDALNDALALAGILEDRLRELFDLSDSES